MGTELFSLYMSLPKEYNKLLRKAEKLMRTILSSHEGLPAGGQFGPIKFINTCVADSFLMALYICYNQHEHIASLFNFSPKLRAPMVFLRKHKYNEAKAAWLFWTQYNVVVIADNVADTSKVMIITDAWSKPEDHLHMFSDLILMNKKLSKFNDLGTVYPLGFRDADPLLILVDIDPVKDTTPPAYIDDDYYRTFEHIFLLMSKITHMTSGLHLFDRWVLYDDLKPSYEDFKPNEADFKEFQVHFAGYVKTQNDHQEDVPIGVPEEGYYGTVPFNPSRDFSYEKEHLD